MATTTTTKKMFSSMLVMIMISTVLLGLCSATIYKVGDSEGWTPKEDVYYAWAKGKGFNVGDSLVFEYDRNFNDVTQVSGALESEFCDTSYPIAVYNTGHDVVTLTEPGFHYFVTSNQGQCILGQKLGVLVVDDPSRSIPPPPPTNNLPLGKYYKVGDSKGWGVYDSEYYNKWSQEKKFQVGDTLVFEYDEEDNDVLEISGELEFISCYSFSPISVHKTGYDLVKLTKPGVHYFISSKTGHCYAGLKLRVVIGPIPDVPKLPPNNRLNRWLHTFRPHH